MLRTYTRHLLKSIKRMAGAESKENDHISHSTISLNSKKEEKRFTPRLKNLQFYYRSERHAT
jgi:ABC-type dipeptide/oligopeptide/nickel transport system ATPase component